ncbi:DUF4350 domain-containing protein [Chitinophaga lutea]
MRVVIIILTSLIVLALLAFFVLAGIGSAERSQQDAERRFQRQHATYGYKDKGPYGTFAAFKLLPDMFGEKKARIATRSFSATNKSMQLVQQTGGLYIIVAGSLHTSVSDVNAMYNYVSFGNDLFVVTEKTDSLFEATFNFTTAYGDSVHMVNVIPETAEQRFANVRLAPDTLYRAKGLGMHNSFVLMDTAVTTILGMNQHGEPNYIRCNIGNGRLHVLLNPMTWTNNFVLTGNNVRCLEQQLAYFNQYRENIYWDDFYHNQRGPRTDADEDFSSWKVLMRYPALRWALWVLVLLGAMYALFEGKRRQRVIPMRAPLANSSLDFVQTLGRLYYLHHNNRNLAMKMTQHLLEHVRQQYLLNTSRLDDVFVDQLARKSGHPAAFIRTLVLQIDSIRRSGDISDYELRDFYDSIYQFYSKNK